MAGETFNDVLTAAVADFAEHGFDSAERLAYWQARLKQAAELSMTPDDVMDQMLQRALRDIFEREIERGGILKLHPGADRFTLSRVKPHLRAELDRRILVSADLIRLNKTKVVQQTLQRFAGWATSIPLGGSDQVKKGEEKARIRKSLSGLPFEERRVLIDQGHKLNSSLSEILAQDGGAIAGKWHSRWRQAGYDYREDHKDRDEVIFVVRGSWAFEQGLAKPAGRRYVDQITRPAEEPFCRCKYQWLYTLRELPPDMVTAKGREALQAAA